MKDYLITVTTGDWMEPDEIWGLASVDSLEEELKRCSESHPEHADGITVWERTGVQVVATRFEVQNLPAKPEKAKRRTKVKKKVRKPRPVK